LPAPSNTARTPPEHRPNIARTPPKHRPNTARRPLLSTQVKGADKLSRGWERVLWTHSGPSCPRGRVWAPPRRAALAKRPGPGRGPRNGSGPPSRPPPGARGADKLPMASPQHKSGGSSGRNLRPWRPKLPNYTIDICPEAVSGNPESCTWVDSSGHARRGPREAFLSIRGGFPGWQGGPNLPKSAQNQAGEPLPWQLRGGAPGRHSSA
jgi:hypothetical protein